MSNKQYGTMAEDIQVPPYTASSEEAQVENDPPPPSYTQTQNEAPPPSYESVFGEIQEARRNAEGNRGHFLKSVCLILFNTIGFTILVVILLAIPALMIVVGALNLDRCPAEKFIPIWLIVGGSVLAFLQIMSILRRIKNKCTGQEEDGEREKNKLYNAVSSSLGCFNIAWFIVGNVWVYREYPPNTSDAEAVNFCDHTTYYLAFWLITSIYICIGFLCCCSCCIAMCAGAGSKD